MHGQTGRRRSGTARLTDGSAVDLLALADFNLVARHGGFGRAARATGRPKATLSRRVMELEASLGLRLFERGVGRPRLTDQGRVLHERTAQLLAEIHDIAEAIASGEDRPRGRLRISAPCCSPRRPWAGSPLASSFDIPRWTSRPRTERSTSSRKATTSSSASIRRLTRP